jgi:diaminohydroxyphosphoribosylaminopyrimidine deaminase/5-amino-6-(5-phosphoribosylamino)uracil reductase
VVLDGRLRSAPAELPAGALLLAAPDAPAEREAALAARGVEIQRCDAGPDGRLLWASVLEQLAARRLGVVLVEGGAQVAASLLEAEIPHRVHLFCAPAWLGGDGPALSSYLGPELRYQTWRVRRLGEDVEWVVRRPGLPGPPSRPA